MGRSENEIRVNHRRRALSLALSLLLLPAVTHAKPKKRPAAPPAPTVEQVQANLDAGNSEAAVAIGKRILIDQPFTRMEKRTLDALKAKKIDLYGRFSESDWLARAEGLIRKGLPLEAVKIYKKLDPANRRYKAKVAEATYKARDYKTAAALYEDLLREPGQNRATILSLLATCNGRTDQFAKAIRYHEDIIRRFPGSHLAKASQKKLAFLHFDSGDYKEARAAYKKLAGKGPIQDDLQWKILWSSYLLKDYDDALTRLNALYAKERAPREKARLVYWRARILEKTGNRAEAEKIYDELETSGASGYYAYLAAHQVKKITARGTGTAHKFKPGGNPYSGLVAKFSKKYNLDPKIALSIMRQESNFRPHVVSSAKAMGLMQIIPQTAMEIAEALGRSDFYPEDLRDPATNVEFGVWYLKKLHEQHGHPEYAIAGYNAGPDAVARWRRWGDQLAMDEFIELIPYAETNNYVKKVLTNYWSDW